MWYCERMEKKINNFIKKIEILESPLDKLNELIEEKCINSSVLIICDFLTIKNYKTKLQEIESTSVNNITIKVLSANQLNEQGENIINEVINETYDLIVGIGEFCLLKFVENFAIKTNITYGLVNLFELKCEIFCNNISINYENDKYFPPFFVLINKIKYSKEEIFNAKLNIFKYYYLFLEYNLHIIKNDNLKNFLLIYKDILSSLNDENIINNLIALGLILNKFSIKYFIKNSSLNEFENFLCSTCVISIYQSIFVKINNNNLYFSRRYKNDKNKIFEFTNFNFDFNKFYLLSMKNNICKITMNLKKCFLNFSESLKQTSIEYFYYKSKFINSKKIFNLIKNNKDTLFLNFLDNFEIFNF